MIDSSTIVVGVICGLLICAFFCYGVACGRREVEKELKDQYLAVIKHLNSEIELLKRELLNYTREKNDI